MDGAFVWHHFESFLEAALNALILWDKNQDLLYQDHCIHCVEALGPAAALAACGYRAEGEEHLIWPDLLMEAVVSSTWVEWQSLWLSSDRPGGCSWKYLAKQYYWTEFRGKVIKCGGLGPVGVSKVWRPVVLLALYLRASNSPLVLLEDRFITNSASCSSWCWILLT